ncbi:MAG: AarF/UbiB family protein [Ignisphaera sp.]
MILRTLKIILKLGPRFLNYRRIRKMLINEEKVPEELLRSEGKKLAKALMELGPTFIKLGQIWSVRSDLFPQEYLEELSKLQDEVPPAPYEEILKIVREDVKGYDVKIDKEVIGSASLGQVHKGYFNGKEVAIKVNRPRVKEILEEDIRIIKRLIPFLKILFDEGFIENFRIILDEFSKGVFEELDYTKEAFYMEKIRNELGDSSVRVPKVLLATRRVLIMEYIPGYKITSKEAIEKFGRSYLARKVFRLYVKMLVENEYFHADPHPGNLAVDGAGNLILYDYGIVGKLDDRTKRLLIRAYLSIRNFDTYSLLQILEELGALDPYADKRLLARGIELFLRGVSGEEVNYAEIEDFMRIANKVFYKFPLRLPSKLFYALRTLLVLEGTCRLIDPEFNILKELEEFFKERRFNIILLVERMRNTLDSLIARIKINYLDRGYYHSYALRREGSNQSNLIRGGALITSIISLLVYLMTRDIYLSFIILVIAVLLSLLFTRS